MCFIAGLSVVSVCLVDGQGNQVRLLQCPKPSSLAYLDIASKQDLEAFVVTQTFEIQPNSKRPGTIFKIYIRMWYIIFIVRILSHKYEIKDVFYFMSDYR